MKPESYEEFLERVKRNLEDEDLDVEIRNIEKMNGISYAGLVICEKGERAGISIDLRDAYEWYTSGEADYDQIFGVLLNRINSALWGMPEIGEEMLRPAPENIVFQAVNAEWSADLLTRVPHRRIGMTDLALIARIMMEMPDEDGGTVNGSTVIDQNVLEMNGLTEGELFGSILMKVAERRPACFCLISDLLHGLGETSAEKEFVPLYVATIGQGEYGSGVLGYPNFLQHVHDELGDMYVLPSSVHEVLILPVKEADMETEELIRIVCDVNDTQLEEKDKLSYSVYYYDGHDLVQCKRKGTAATVPSEVPAMR